LHLAADDPEHRPNLPATWRALSMRFQWQGRWRELKLPEDEGGDCRTGDDP
jgi:hypothetical protein